MAFRFPGDLADEQSLWNALKTGRDLVSQVPSERWAVDELRHPKRAEPGRSNTFSAGVLSRIDEFDAGFFGISPREAAWLDPQQRLLLELAWESMENAGCVPSSLAGSDCAVYVGISSLDYGTRGLDDLASLSAHSMTGNTLSIAANRLSYIFDLRGPSLAVDTACSSSLVALHHACNSLRTGEASTALVGGVNLLLHPYPFVGFTKASMLSADGRCKAFDASGDGYVRAEGGAVLLLKPFAKALADGDNIQAIIRATGVNADGARKTGLTIPSRAGQAELMRNVLAKSGLQPENIDFIEAHGTGTAVGDPIETAAIGSVYGQCRPTEQPLPIGSVKTNLGHLESASGMAGLVKAVLALKNRALPPSLHLATPNPNIDFSGLNLEVVSTYRELTKADHAPLVAGVNSFGFGGANAHVLLQEYCQKHPKPLPGVDCSIPPLFLSARTPGALRDIAGRYADLLRKKTPEDFYDIAYAAAYRRERMERRLALKTATVEGAIEMLAKFAQGEVVDQVVIEDSLQQPGGVAFVYSGNGAQWVGMGQKLIAESTRFAEIFTNLDAAMHPVTGFSVIDELHASEFASKLGDTTVAQPLLFAVQVALTTWLGEQGVKPLAVAGHSVGEVAAAWAAGALDLDQAIRVICMRSMAQGLTRGTGRMAAVALSESAMKELLTEMGLALAIEIAGINSPGNITISGSLSDLERIGAPLEARGIFFRLLDLDYAFHSRQMDLIETRLVESLAGLAPASSDATTFVSTVTGDVLEGTKLDADYWWHNVRQPVRFADAMAKLLSMGCRVFVEIGPNAILQRYIGECLNVADVQGRVLPTLRKNDDGLARIEEAVLRTQLLQEIPRLDYFPIPGRHVHLPNYPWQRERHWHPVTSESHRVIEHHRVHPLLGWRLSGADFAWENVLDPLTLPWLADHQVGGAIVFPGAAYAEMALAAAREWHGKAWLTIEEFDIVSPVVFDGEHGRSMRFNLNPRDGGFQIQSRQRLSADEWTLHAVGRIIETTARSIDTHVPPLSSGEETFVVDRTTHYRLATTLGLQYGPSFQGLGDARVQGDVLEATLDLPEPVAHEVGYLLHPAVLDICYQSLVDFFRDDIEAGRGVALLPVKLGKLVCRNNPHPDEAMSAINGFRVRLRRRSARSVLADFELLDSNGHVVAQSSGCRFRAAPLQKQSQSHVDLWRIVPRLQPHPVDGLVTDLPPPNELAKRIYAWFNEHEPKLGRESWFKQTLPLFEALTLSFAFEAFRTLFQQRPEWLQENLVDRSAAPYLRWLANCLRQEQLLVERAGVWRLEGEIPPADEIWQAILRDSPASLPQLAMFGQIGRHLPALLTAEIDPQSFLARMRQSASAESLHDEDPAYLGTRQAVQQTLAALAAELPARRRLRILELTDGVSEVPRAVHALLPEDRLDYVLVVPDDVARERSVAEYQNLSNVVVASIVHADWSLVADKPIPAAFDVVVLRHVLHRAASPKVVLTKAKRWLAHGGVLLVAEQHPDWSADFVSGLDPAWWHEYEEGLPMSPLLPPEAWGTLLREEGFESVEQVTEPAAKGLSEGAYLLIASRSAKESAAFPVAETASWRLLVDAASAPCADHLRRRLEAQGQQVAVSTPLQDGERHVQAFDHVVYMRGWKATASDHLDLPADLLQQLQFASTRAGKPPRFWLLTHGGAAASELVADCTPNPLQTALWGMGRVAMNENPALSCTLIDLACDPDKAHVPGRLENELLRPDGLNEIVLSQEARYSLSMCEVPQVGKRIASERYRLDFHVPGKLSNLRWLPETEPALKDHEIEVRPHAVGLNFRDVMYLMGLLPDEAVENGFAGASLGLEFSGVVTRVGDRVRDYAPGDAVMGFGPACFASHVITRADAVAPMPENWSFEAAATVPTVFFTVYYALHHLADLQPGERVLIHGAAGGVGLAAIQLARHIGAEIFATAGSDEKRDFVHLLGADHVFDSRNLSFADDILAVTQGEGVDVVLNSLTGEAIRRNLRVLKPFGRFLELGKRDFYENTPIGLRPFKDNISYFGIDADQLLTGRPALAARLFREVMALFREGALTPLPCRVFAAERVVDAFRVMQQARHIGKVVVSMDGAAPRVEHFRDVGPVASSRFEKDSSWLVTGGLSGFGLESARWLAEHGVGHLVLLGRRGLATPGAQEAIGSLQAQGINVEALTCDIADRDALAAVIERIQKTLPPLKGVLHAAATFDDALLAKLDAERMTNVLRPKLLGAWHLHQLTLDISIEHFVLYSSVTTYIGNPGQANYVAANAGLEGLAALRHVMGLPATCIAWGPIGDAGFLTRHEAVKESLAQRLGKAPLSAAEALAQLNHLLNPDAEPFAIANFDWSVLSRMLPSAQSTRFAGLNRQKKAGSGLSEPADIRSLIAGKSPEEVATIVRELVVQEVSQILCIGTDRIEPQRSLHDLGMDSLMAVELALGLEQRFGIQLPVMMLNESPTAEKVTERIVNKLLGGADHDASSEGNVDALVQDLAKQHGENVTVEEVQHIAEGARMMVQEGARLTA